MITIKKVEWQQKFSKLLPPKHNAYAWRKRLRFSRKEGGKRCFTDKQDHKHRF